MGKVSCRTCEEVCAGVVIMAALTAALTAALSSWLLIDANALGRDLEIVSG